MVICLNTLSRPCHRGGDQARWSGEASRRLPDASQDPDQKSAMDPEGGMLWAQPKKLAKRNKSSPAVRAWFCSLTACHPGA